MDEEKLNYLSIHATILMKGLEDLEKMAGDELSMYPNHAIAMLQCMKDNIKMKLIEVYRKKNNEEKN